MYLTHILSNYGQNYGILHRFVVYMLITDVSIYNDTSFEQLCGITPFAQL